MISNRRRTGFTIIELLVVIAILLLLAALSYAVFSTGKSSDKMRSGARSAQSAILGAKDRAMHAKELRGVRLMFDQTNLNLVNGFVYLQPLPLQTATGIQVTRPNAPANMECTTVVIPGSFLYSLDLPTAMQPNGQWPSTGVFVRIPSGNGVLYQLQQQSLSAPFWCTLDGNNNTNLTFFQVIGAGNPKSVFPQSAGKTPIPANYNAIDSSDGNASIDIQLGNDVLPFHQPMTLPSGCVIDLCRSQIPPSWYSQQSVLPNSVPQGWVICANDPATPGNVIVRQYQPPLDIMFSPRGNVTGTISALGAIFFCLRDMRDATRLLDPADPTAQGESYILALYPQTGLVQTFEADLSDVRNNVTGASGSDSLADDIFTFAKRGLSAGR